MMYAGSTSELITAELPLMRPRPTYVAGETTFAPAH